MEKLLTPAQVAYYFGVTTRVLQDWRSSRAKGSLRYLPCVPAPDHKSQVRYRLADIMDFIRRNPRYADRAYARIAQEHLLVEGAIVLLPN